MELLDNLGMKRTPVLENLNFTECVEKKNLV